MSDGVCACCGSSALRLLDRRERLVVWFRSGHGANAVRCERCGASAGSDGWYRLGSQDLGPAARVRQLPQLWRYLRHARTWDPTPRFYAIVTGVGLLVGVAAAAVTRRRWLVVGVPLGAFITTFAVAVRPLLSRQGRDLVREFVDPVGTRHRELVRKAAALRDQHGRVPVLVPAAWSGPVRLVGIELSTDGDATVRSITIAADPPGRQAATPRVVLRTRTPDEFDPDAAVMVVANAEHPGNGTQIGPPEADLQIYEMPEPSDELIAQLQASWRNTTLTVDGEPLDARLLVGHDAQVATINLDDHVIEITAHGVDLAALPLHRPTDLDALISAYETDQRAD